MSLTENDNISTEERSFEDKPLDFILFPWSLQYPQIMLAYEVYPMECNPIIYGHTYPTISVPMLPVIEEDEEMELDSEIRFDDRSLYWFTSSEIVAANPRSTLIIEEIDEGANPTEQAYIVEEPPDEDEDAKPLPLTVSPTNSSDEASTSKSVMTGGSQVFN
ncbi:uncharacterized protein LOC131434463 [Malaya genurostris]|uniref:uncharacterized protein LOC131434463 n=1 Tax=Malaya genurostris TaxID=325434 RepID=UPI0026F38D0D|nr:uncharacterized protein LOC131434463 [Malaya genurostris]